MKGERTMEYEMNHEEIANRQQASIKEENVKIINALISFARQSKITTRDLSAINKSVKELKKRGIIPIDDKSVKEAILL